MALEDLDRGTFTSHSLDETDSFAEGLVKRILPNSTILLNGEIGSGKTYLCSRIASGFGIEDLTSSSFGRVSMHAGERNVVHCDFYRSALSHDFFSLEVEPLLVTPWLLLVEWWKNEEPIIESERMIEIEVRHKGSTSREFCFNFVNSGSRPRC